MATGSVGLPLPASRLRRPPQALPLLLRGIRARVYLTLALVIAVTLVIAGIVLFFLLGGYQDRLAASTLRQIGGPVYESVTTLADANFQAFEVSRQLQGTVGGESDVLILFVEASGRVVSEASRDPRFRGEVLEIELEAAGVGSAGFIDGTLIARDGTRLNYAATGLEPTAAERFNASHVVFALPNENRQAVLGDLTPRLIIAGGFALLAAIILALLLSRSIYRPLEATTAAARSVARGRYDHKVGVTGSKEARELAESFNQMLEEVQNQQAALRDFLANVSHDLQTPLTSINGFSQALLDGTIEDDDSQSNAYRIIEEESRRLLRLVEGLLDLSRMEAGQLELELEPLNVDELLRHVHDLFALRAEDLNTELVVEAEAVSQVIGDADRLEQVLANLVDNALRYTPPGGRVVLSTRQESEATVSVSVTDSGPGIRAEEVPHLFDRFYKGGRQGGTGLGLAIARELVRAQRGEIQIASTPGEGTTFRVFLRTALHRGGPRRRTLT
ncbi:MAG: HAMP domain-containing sensor histidine kinase [Chloroflexi bacterium]|nr:HAMP domain-containing sensor histidine kinase [Chloroflexota bacterium]